MREAAQILRRGGLVAFPTETVYGLGADADNPTAVARIFAAKGRPAGRPLTIHIGPSTDPSTWCFWDDCAQDLADRFWPGPLTLILPKRDTVADIVTGGFDTVGLRMPSHPMAISLLDTFAGGVAAPSANRTGRLSPTTAEHVRLELGDRVDLILDGGPCPIGVESTVLKLAGQKTILRLGAVSRAQLEEVLGPLPIQGETAPHYQPQTPVSIAFPPMEEAVGVIGFRPAPADFPGTWIQASADPAVYARHLYTFLRQLDQAGFDHIFVEPVPDESAWEAISARLAAAALPG